MKTKRFIPSEASSLLKGAAYDSKDPRMKKIADSVQKCVEPFSVYDQNSVGREAIILHYERCGTRLVGIELCTVDVGQCGPKFIDVYVKSRQGHLGQVPPAPYAKRMAREGNRIYRLFYPLGARSLGMEADKN